MRSDTLYTLQALRCVAALSVVIGHAADLLIPHDAPNAWFWSVPWTAGVDMFFVISGFIMLYLMQGAFGRTGASRDFLVRRIVRIVPTYWFFTTLTVVVVLLAGGQLKGTTIHWQQLLTSYGFIPWPRDDEKMVPIVAQGWTLNYEMLFYALFALALLWRRGLLVLIAMLAGLTFASCIIPPDWKILHFWTNPIVLEFLGGLGIARLHLTGFRLPTIALPTGIGLAIATYTFGDLLGVNAIGRAGTWGIPALLIVASTVLIEQPGRIGPAWRMIRLGGDASYALYLAHYMIVHAVIILWIQVNLGPPVLEITLAVTFSSVAATLFHILLERPINRALHRRFV